jgi:TM2 domain-containing membrane protein YozV
MGIARRLGDRLMQSMVFAPSRRKSVRLAYVLWAFFGLLGLHRLYLGHTLSAAGMAAITLVSVPLIWSGLGLLGFVATGTWALADALLIPGMARETNEPVPATAVAA